MLHWSQILLTQWLQFVFTIRNRKYCLEHLFLIFLLDPTKEADHLVEPYVIFMPRYPLTFMLQLINVQTIFHIHVNILLGVMEI